MTFRSVFSLEPLSEICQELTNQGMHFAEKIVARWAKELFTAENNATKVGQSTRATVVMRFIRALRCRSKHRTNSFGNSPDSFDVSTGYSRPWPSLRCRIIEREIKVRSRSDPALIRGPRVRGMQSSPGFDSRCRQSAAALLIIPRFCKTAAIDTGIMQFNDEPL